MTDQQTASEKVKAIFNTEMPCGVTVKAGMEQLLVLLNTVQAEEVKPSCKENEWNANQSISHIRNLKGHTRFIGSLNDLLQKIGGEKQGPVAHAELAVAASFDATLGDVRASANCAYSNITSLNQPELDATAAAASAATLLASDIKRTLDRTELKYLLPKAVVEYRMQNEGTQAQYGEQVAALLDRKPETRELG